MEQENKLFISYKIDKNFAYNFDVLQNIKIWNRKSSQWFSDANKLMISMRDWTSLYWDEQVWSWWTSWLYFFTDFLRKRHRIKWYNNRVWRLSSTNAWVDLWTNFTWNDFHFNTVKLPLNINWTTPTEYTTPSNATWSELVVKSASDTWWASNIGKTILITDNTWDNQVYRGCFGTITWYDSTTTEYIIWTSWIFWSTTDNFETIIWLKSWSKYRIYDTIWEHLQVSNWVILDRYYYWLADWTLTENTVVQWFATYGLRNIYALSSTQFLLKQVNYSNSYVTFNKWTLYYSAWNVNNPFFHTYINAITIPWTKWWDISDIFVFKKRLIIAWSNFIAFINWITDLIQVELITNSYWMKEKSLIDVWVDAYFMSTDKQIYSLSEIIPWTLTATNVWKQVWNYIKNFNVKLCSWFNGKQLFYYGQYDNSTLWVIVILDIEYKFWSIYTWLNPSSIVVEWWVTYLTDNNSSIVRYFDSNSSTDVWRISITQKVAFNEIYSDSVFKWKIMSDWFLWLDNFTQELYVDIYMANPEWNWRKERKTISIIETDIPTTSITLWEWIVWEDIIWWTPYESEVSFPYMKHIALDWDRANIWKIVLTWKDWSSFYLNEFAINIWVWDDNWTYFSPINTI